MEVLQLTKNALGRWHQSAIESDLWETDLTSYIAIRRFVRPGREYFSKLPPQDFGQTSLSPVFDTPCSYTCRLAIRRRPNPVRGSNLAARSARYQTERNEPLRERTFVGSEPHPGRWGL